MSSSSNSGLPSLSKWQVALLLGTPVAAGLSYYCYKNMCKELNAESPPGPDKNKALSAKSEDKTYKTPLEAAIALKTKGNEVFKEGNYTSALDYYTQAIELCPKDEKDTLAPFYQNRAAAYEKLKKYDEVIVECNAALELNPKYRKALIRRANSYEAKKDYKSALEDITAVCILDNFSDMSVLGQADRLMKDLGKEDAKVLLEKRKPMLPSKNFIKTFTSAFSNDPIFSNADEELKNQSGDAPLSGLYKALKLFQEGKYEKVVEACEEELESADSNELRKKRAELFIATMSIFCEQRSKALEQLSAIINSKDVDPKIAVNALIKRGTLQFQMESYEQCMEDFKTAVQIDDENADIYHHRGQLYILLNELEKAKLDFTVAYTKNPNSPIIAVHKCFADFRYTSERGGSIESCLRTFKKLIEKYPACVECYFLYAQVLIVLQNYEEAEKIFKEVMKIDPNNASLHVHYALLLFQWKGSTEKGIEIIEKALKLDDRCELAYETLGTLKVQNGNLEEAIACFDKALNLAKTYVEIVHILSLKYAAEAQVKVAIRYNLYKDNKVTKIP